MSSSVEEGFDNLFRREHLHWEELLRGFHTGILLPNLGFRFGPVWLQERTLKMQFSKFGNTILRWGRMKFLKFRPTLL